MSDQSSLATHFDSIGMPGDAKAWLLDLWNVIQVLDDAYDGDRAKPEDVSRSVLAIFWEMPLNAFYQRFQSALQPLLLLMVLRWEGANALEAAGQADERTYMARADYYGIVTVVCHLCGIKDAGEIGIRLYGETYAEYIREFA
jgi:hypothetical protein